MTIDLGFASFGLPSGRTVSFVDVPGHERFVATMLAGATGIDASMLVIAADEGVMPQTREHVEILDLLGLTTGVVVLTKIDLVDEEMLEIVRADANDLVRETSLAFNPLVLVSAKSGDGLPLLTRELEKLSKSDSSYGDGLPRLPIDRVFTVKGFGCVVTGTLLGGELTVGQEVEVMPQRRRCRIRGIESHGSRVDHTGSGHRTALNLSGINRDEVARGDVVTRPMTIRGTRRVDAVVRVLQSTAKPLRAMDSVTFHAGAAEAPARIFPLEGEAIHPGHTGWAQIRFDKPLALWRRQRGILRCPSPAKTIGGADVMDPQPRRRAREQDAGRLRDLQSAEIESVITAFLSERGRSAADLGTVLCAKLETLEPLLSNLTSRGRLEMIGNAYMTAEIASALRGRVGAIVEQYHSQYPLRRAIPREVLRRTARLSSAAISDILAPLFASGSMVDLEGAVASSAHLADLRVAAAHVDLPGDSSLVAVLHKSGLMPPAITQLQAQFEIDDEGLRFLADGGRIVRIENDLYLAASMYQQMVASVVRLIAAQGSATIAQLRDSLGVTRKYALAYIEHLDGRNITRRVGDERVPGREFHAHRT